MSESTSRDSNGRFAPLKLWLSALLIFTVFIGNSQTLAPEFVDAGYSIFDAGSVPGVPANYGGLTIRPEEPNTLYIGGSANNSAAALYSIALVRDAESNQVTGFSGTATLVVATPGIDGGVTYAPNGTLLFTQYSQNGFGQVLTDDTYITTDLTQYGVVSSVGSLALVPTGFSGEGHLIIASYNGNVIYNLPYSISEAGEYLLSEQTASVPLEGTANGPEGIAYLPSGSEGFPNPSMVISSYGAGKVVAYDTDAIGFPIVSSARDMITDLSGAEGALIDPVTGDFLFSTFGGNNRVIVMSGFENPNDCAGVPFGESILDECEVCRLPDDPDFNSTCTDCAGAVNGTAFLDNCEECVGGDTGLTACIEDCNGDFGGTSELDECGVCDDNPDNDNETCTDCAGVANGDAFFDICGDCVGGTTGEEACTFDCPVLEANIGDDCDDGNEFTENDVIGANCECSGELIPQENNSIACADGIDNDGDGLTDCDDPECEALSAGCSTCFSDGTSFADVVIDYTNTCPNNIYTDPSEALGVPDFGVNGEANHPSLGEGGHITLGFTDNTLTNSGNSDPDLFVFEVGPLVEGSTIELRPLNIATENQIIDAGIVDSDEDGFYEFGAISGATAVVDIDSFFDNPPAATLQFDAIKITDIPGGCSGASPGADIDGVCALSSVPCGIGSACDDGDDMTENDIINNDCQCVGEPIATATLLDLDCGGQVIQITGAIAGGNGGGTATDDTRTVYAFAPDGGGDVPTYSGSSWPFVILSGSILVDENITAILTNNDDGVLLVNGNPAYQFVGDAGSSDASGTFGPWSYYLPDGTPSQDACPEVFDCPTFQANIGDTCDDNDEMTENDMINANCACEGTPIIVWDCPSLEANFGDECDDGNDDLIPGIINDNCECIEQFECPVLGANIGDTCDDGDADTMNDTVSDLCVCAGIVEVLGCIDPSASNFNPDANVSDGTCLYLCDTDPADLLMVTTFSAFDDGSGNAYGSPSEMGFLAGGNNIFAGFLWNVNTAGFSNNGICISIDYTVTGDVADFPRLLEFRIENNGTPNSSNFNLEVPGPGTYTLSGNVSTGTTNGSGFDPNGETPAIVAAMAFFPGDDSTLDGDVIVEFSNLCVSTDCFIEFDCPDLMTNIGDACDDGDANTTNDTVNDLCICTGIVEILGCTDPSASNYNPDAEVSDGSCLYLCDTDPADLLEISTETGFNGGSGLSYGSPSGMGLLAGANNDFGGFLWNVNTTGFSNDGICISIDYTVTGDAADFPRVLEFRIENNGTENWNDFNMEVPGPGTYTFGGIVSSGNVSGSGFDPEGFNPSLVAAIAHFTDTPLIADVNVTFSNLCVSTDCAIAFDCPELEANIGDACDDGNPETEDDMVNASCNCVGTPIVPNDCEDWALYMNNNLGGETDVFGVDISSGDAELTWIATVEYQGHIALNPENHFIYVINNMNASFVTVDPLTGFVSGSVFLDMDIASITTAAFAPNGKLLMGTMTEDVIYSVDLTTPVPAVSVFDAFAPINGGDIAFDSAGMLYLATRSGNGFYEVYPDDVLADQLIGSIPSLVTGMALTGSEQMIMSHKANSDLLLRNLDGTDAEVSYPLMLDGEAYAHADGDMTSGCLIGFPCCPSPCFAFSMFYVDHEVGGNGSLYGVSFTATDANLSLLTTVDFPAHIGFNATDDEIYLVNPDGSFIRGYNPTTEVFLGDLPLTGLPEVVSLVAVVYNSADGLLYAGDMVEGKLYTIDLGTGAATFFADAPVNGGDLSIQDGTLYLAGRTDNKLYEIADGVAVEIGLIPVQVNGMAQANSPAPTDLIIANNYASVFTKVNAADASVVATYAVMLDGNSFTCSNGDMAAGCSYGNDSDGADDDSVIEENNVVEVAGMSTISSFPNPTNGLSQVVFVTAETGRTLVEAYDMNGRNVSTLFNQEAQAGIEYRVDYNGSSLPNGIYIYRLTTNNESIIDKFMIAR